MTDTSATIRERMQALSKDRQIACEQLAHWHRNGLYWLEPIALEALQDFDEEYLKLDKALNDSIEQQQNL